MSIRLRHLIALGFLLVAAALQAEESTLQIIEVQHRSAEELLPVLRPLVEPQGSISAMQNKLVIRTSPANFQQLKQIVSQLDTTPRQLLITVSQGGEINTRGSSAQVSGKAKLGNSGSITLPPANPHEPGIAVGNENGTAEIRGSRNSSRTGLSSNQQLRVLEGREAVIYVGQSVPITSKYKSHSGAPVLSTEYHDVTVGFSVLPRLQGEQVTLEISPHQDSLASDASGVHGAINVQRISTSVSGRLGEWIDIGGATQQAVEQSQGLLSHRDSSRDEHRQVLVKVEETH